MITVTDLRIRKYHLFICLFFLTSSKSLGQPSISSFSPNSTTVGQTVSIIGSGFDATPSNNLVELGISKANITFASTTMLTVDVPYGCTYGPISVTNLINHLKTSSIHNFMPTFIGNNGNFSNSSLASKIDFTTGSAPSAMACNDLDGDGKPDLAVTNLNSNTVSVFRNTCSTGSIDASSFTSKIDFTVGISPMGIAIADIDIDGKPDLIISANSSNYISILRNTSTPGSISFASRINFSTGTAPWGIAVDDLNNDGRPDIVIANNFSSSISIYRNITTNPGSITFSSLDTRVDYSSISGPAGIAIADMDSDGKKDIIISGAGNTLYVLKNIMATAAFDNSSFALPLNFALNGSSNKVIIGDIDKDGKEDIIVTNGNYLSFFRNRSISGVLNATSFDPKVDYLIGTNAQGVAEGDINGDGILDFSLCYSSSTPLSLINNKNTSGSILTSLMDKFDYATGTNYGTASSLICDIDADGKPDIIAMNTSANSISIFKNVITAGTLPVHLLDFKGYKQNQRNLLMWETAQEENTDRFIIEHSNNGNNFKMIGYVKAMGNSSYPVTYQLIHNYPNEGTNYYRIKIIDKDSSFSYSHLLLLQNKLNITLRCQPNPAHDIIEVIHPGQANSRLIIFDKSGSKIKEIMIKDDSTFSILDVQSLTKGVYIICWTDDKNTLFSLFIHN